MRHSVFTLEVCARYDGAPALLDELRAIVKDAPERPSRHEAWSRHALAAEAILRNFDCVEKGCWEYFDDELSAMSMYDDWCRPILDQVVPRQGPSGGAGSYRDDAGPRYLAFTVVYLLAYGSPSDLSVRESCEVPQADLWRKSTFRRLLAVVRTLSFASVKGDAMYMTPRDPDWGLTAADLDGEAYKYLRVVGD
jgi:hypothetical protein